MKILACYLSTVKKLFKFNNKYFRIMYIDFALKFLLLALHKDFLKDLFRNSKHLIYLLFSKIQKSFLKITWVDWLLSRNFLTVIFSNFLRIAVWRQLLLPFICDGVLFCIPRKSLLAFICDEVLFCIPRKSFWKNWFLRY